MISLQRTEAFNWDDMLSTHNYADDKTAQYFLASSFYNYYVCEDDIPVGLLGISQTSSFSLYGLLWAGFFPNFAPSIRSIREAKSLGEVFFAAHDLHLVAEVDRQDKKAANFLRYLGMTPTINNTSRQLYERL